MITSDIALIYEYTVILRESKSFVMSEWVYKRDKIRSLIIER